MQTDPTDQRISDRRGPDRRKTQLTPLPFPDRREKERRSGVDRRGRLG